MTVAARERRAQAVKLADALNAIEGVPVSEYAQNAVPVLGKRRIDRGADERGIAGFSSEIGNCGRIGCLYFCDLRDILMMK